MMAAAYHWPLQQRRQPAALVACMGGWCTQRHRCAHYAQADRSAAEDGRLCPTGVEEPEALARPSVVAADAAQHDDTEAAR